MRETSTRSYHCVAFGSVNPQPWRFTNNSLGLPHAHSICVCLSSWVCFVFVCFLLYLSVCLCHGCLLCVPCFVPSSFPSHLFQFQNIHLYDCCCQCTHIIFCITVFVPSTSLFMCVCPPITYTQCLPIHMYGIQTKIRTHLYSYFWPSMGKWFSLIIWIFILQALQVYSFLFGGFSSSEDILHFTTRPVPIPFANLSHHQVQKFAITTITDVGTNKQMRETNTPCVPFDVFLSYHQERCEKVDHVRHRGFERMFRQASFSPSVFCRRLRHCRPLAVSQITRRKDIEVLHKFEQP